MIETGTNNTTSVDDFKNNKPDNPFDFSGYELIDNESFYNNKEPFIVFYYDHFYVNAACLKLFPEIKYVQILINQEKKDLIVFPCNSLRKDAFTWCRLKNKRIPVKILCRVFTSKLYQLMGWDAKYRYVCRGEMVQTNNQVFLLFHLSSSIFYEVKNKAVYNCNLEITDITDLKFGKEFLPLEETQNEYFKDHFVLKINLP